MNLVQNVRHRGLHEGQCNAQAPQRGLPVDKPHQILHNHRGELGVGWERPQQVAAKVEPVHGTPASHAENAVRRRVHLGAVVAGSSRPPHRNVEVLGAERSQVSADRQHKRLVASVCRHRQHAREVELIAGQVTRQLAQKRAVVRVEAKRRDLLPHRRQHVVRCHHRRESKSGHVEHAHIARHLVDPLHRHRVVADAAERRLRHRRRRRVRHNQESVQVAVLVLAVRELVHAHDRPERQRHVARVRVRGHQIAGRRIELVQRSPGRHKQEATVVHRRAQRGGAAAWRRHCQLHGPLLVHCASCGRVRNDAVVERTHARAWPERHVRQLQVRRVRHIG